jgi:tetratricopeptide (TPR) repeat protein
MLPSTRVSQYCKIKEEVLLLEQVVKIQEQTLKGDHPDRLASQHVLAGAYEANGQVKEAVSLLEQVVRIQERTLAEDHPSRVASQHELATVYWDLGRRNAALQMMKDVVHVHRQLLDEHHPARTDKHARNLDLHRPESTQFSSEGRPQEKSIMKNF